MKQWLNDTIGQLFTFVGLFTAWICLEGTAKTVVGWLTLISGALWFLTYPIRKDDAE
jgi:hypothetical protein